MPGANAGPCSSPWLFGRARSRWSWRASAPTRACVQRALACVVLGIGCRQSESPPRPAEPTAQQEARALVEQARREVEEGSAEPAPPGAAGTRVHAPAGGPEKLPLLVFLHGLGGSGRELSEGLHLTEMADAFGFAFIAPEGVLDHSGRRFWNAGPSCCNFDDIAVDHIALLGTWIGQATAHPRVDARRVYLVGFSNGGFMAYRAACEMSSRLAGIVSIAGAGPSDPSKCKPERPISVVQIHGDRDPIVKFDGGYLFADTRRPRIPSAQKSVAAWAKLDACTGDAIPTRELDLDPRVPGAETQVTSYAGCSGHRVELWRIPGGDHTAGLNRYSLRAILDFIAADSPAGDAP
jgi:polyhydroxybutyrate depolymerase